MNLDTTQLNAINYQIATPVYEGPLDLLLQLIERAELDITRLALAQVTDQFLAYLRELEEKTVEEVSSFLVVATRLMQIKSEALLPRPPALAPDEEDAGEMLLQQLIVYKRYKELAGILGERERLGLHTYLRLAPPPKVEGKLDLSDVSVHDLFEAAQRAFALSKEQLPLSTIVRAPKVTIREKISKITETMRKKSKATFRAILGQQHSRIDVVVTFLAVLELIKRFRITAHQEKLFGDIELERSEAWNDDVEFELEFAE